MNSGFVDELVRAARERVPFYRRHLADVSSSDLASLPSFDKQMTAGHGRFPLSAGGTAGAYRVAATSGTSGDRLCVAFDRHDWDRVGAWLGAVGRAVGLTSSDVVLNTHGYGLWVGGPVLDLLTERCDACLVPIGPVGPSGVMQFLAEGIGTAICATPSYLRRLIEGAESTGFDLRGTSLRLGFIGGEGAEASLREKLLPHLPEGFRWVELYGLTETGGPSVAFSPDPCLPELALNMSDFRVEVLDLKADEPVQPGVVGELTLTSRWPDSRTPLIRYRTRDLVRVTAGDPTAPARVSRILGRVDEALKVRGVLIYPSSLAEIVSEVLPTSAEWRAVARRLHIDDDELFVEAEASAPACQAMERSFRERLGLRVAVHPIPPGTLVRSRQKTRRIVVHAGP